MAPSTNGKFRTWKALMRHQFRMNERGRLQAVKIWKNAKESNDSFDQYARRFL